METILGVAVPRLCVPVSAGRNIAILVEVAARNHLLKLMGSHAAREFLAGLGQPGSGTGDLHVRVQLWTPDPDALSEEELQLIRELGKLSAQPPQQMRGKGFWTRMREALGA